MKNINPIQQSTSTHWVGNGFSVRTVFSFDAVGGLPALTH